MSDRSTVDVGTMQEMDGAEKTDADDGGEVLEAETWAVDESPEAAVQVRVYVVTGRHGWFTIPESFCRECHMFTRRADAAAERIDQPVDVAVISWWTHFPWALLRGGYHPPVLTVDGEMLCQGHDVPTEDEVESAIRSALER